VPDISEIEIIRQRLSDTKLQASYFFTSFDPEIYEVPKGLLPNQQRIASEVRTLFVETMQLVRSSQMFDDFDTKALRRAMRESDAALRLRSYYEWEAEVLHDEGTVLGMKGAGFSENTRLTPFRALQEFDKGLQEISRRLDILGAEGSSSERHRPVVAAGTPALELIPNSAFIMMMMDPNNPELEDTKNAIKEEFARFDIRAVRSDEIEHSDEITQVILEHIRKSEFLIADLTYERPSVYYEIGYAHAIGKRPILFKKSSTRLHFDLSVHNCPDYINLTDLRSKLHSRLKAITGRE
jgi:hypothetical protein